MTNSMSEGRRHGGLPLAVYVLALVLVPLAGLGWFGVREIQRNNQLSADTARLATLVELQAAATTMRGPLEVERLIALDAVAGATEADADAERLDVESIVADELGALERAQQRLSAAVADEEVVPDDWRRDHGTAMAQVSEVMAAVAAGEPIDVASIDDAFDRVVATLVGLAATSEAQAERVVPPSLREADLVAGISIVDDVVSTAATEVRDVVDAALLGERPAMSAIVGSTLRHSDALASLYAVDGPAARTLESSYQGLIELDPMSSAPKESSGASSTEVLDERVGYLGEISQFAFDETEQAVDAIGQRSSAAEQENRQTLLVFGLVGVASLLFGIVVIRSFARPLTRLRSQAERIGRGELAAEPLPLAGPSDVRKVTGAVNDMASTLSLVDEHMQALALSDLDGGPRLVDLPGKVGASMRNSMERVTALTTRLRASEARLAEEARIDNLTGLPNRFAVLEHLDALTRALSGSDGIAWRPNDSGLVDTALDELDADGPGEGSADDRPPGAASNDVTVGVMFLDVDGFKSVNDTHGHAVGDVVLREIAMRLRGSVREIDFVARLGGDEFLIIVSGVRDARALTRFGERLIGEVEQPYVIGDQLFAVSASVGVTLVEGGDDALAAIERADAAVYQAKRRGRRRVELYDHELQASIEHQAELELALRQAIRHDELRVHLQPLADLATGRPIGAEALVRWERPGVGLVPPGEFIPIAERSGLIFDLERWVLVAACQRVAEWRLRDLGAGMRLAVNISGRHLIEGDLLSTLDAAIEATGADPHLLEIELTESHLLDDVKRAQSVLAGVRERGIKVAIDDFGTGYSSMTYLQKLPVDIIKIDRSFVASATSNEFDSTVIDSVVTISRALSLDIVAEGIETVEQLEYVTAAGCTYGQGFYLARPMPIHEAETLLFGGPLYDVDRLSTAWTARPPIGEPVAVDLDVSAR